MEPNTPPPSLPSVSSLDFQPMHHSRDQQVILPIRSGPHFLIHLLKVSHMSVHIRLHIRFATFTACDKFPGDKLNGSLIRWAHLSVPKRKSYDDALCLWRGGPVKKWQYARPVPLRSGVAAHHYSAAAWSTIGY